MEISVCKTPQDGVSSRHEVRLDLGVPGECGLSEYASLMLSQPPGALNVGAVMRCLLRAEVRHVPLEQAGKASRQQDLTRMCQGQAPLLCGLGLLARFS